MQTISKVYEKKYCFAINNRKMKKKSYHLEERKLLCTTSKFCSKAAKNVGKQ